MLECPFQSCSAHMASAGSRKWRKVRKANRLIRRCLYMPLGCPILNGLGLMIYVVELFPYIPWSTASEMWVPSEEKLPLCHWESHVQFGLGLQTIRGASVCWLWGSCSNMFWNIPYLSIYLSIYIYVTICLYIYVSLSVYIYICFYLSIYDVFIDLSIRLCFYLSTYPSIHRSINLYIYDLLYLNLYLSKLYRIQTYIYIPSIHPSTHLLIYLPICMYQYFFCVSIYLSLTQRVAELQTPKGAWFWSISGARAVQTQGKSSSVF